MLKEPTIIIPIGLKYQQFKNEPTPTHLLLANSTMSYIVNLKLNTFKLWEFIANSTSQQPLSKELPSST
jgi:hypothetical protein